MSLTQKIDDLITENRLQEAILSIDEQLKSNPENDELYFVRGRLFWRLGDRRRAINDYGRAVEINPQSKAAYALENAREVLSFFNPDLLNP